MKQRVLAVFLAIIMVFGVATTSLAAQPPEGETPVQETTIPEEEVAPQPPADEPEPSVQEEDADAVQLDDVQPQAKEPPLAAQGEPEAPAQAGPEMGTQSEQGMNAQAVAPVQVNLRIEYREQTLQVPIDLTVNYKPLTQYGLGITKDPGMITPLHVLAEYFDQHYAQSGGAAGNIATDKTGYLKSILGKNGSVNNAASSGWLYAVNDVIPSNDGIGYAIANYPVQNGDTIVIYSVWNSYPTAAYYSYFENKTYSAETGDPVVVKLLSRNIFDYSGTSAVAGFAGAKITINGAEIPVTTDTNGVANVVFQETGTYVLGATHKNGVNVDSSRPYAVVIITASQASLDQQTVDADKAALTLPAYTSQNLDLPSVGSSGKTAISWSSGDTTVITNEGKIIRPAVGGNASAVLTATIRRGAVTDSTSQFTVAVESYADTAEVQADIAAIVASWNTGSSRFTAVEGTDANLVTSLQAKADAIVLGSVVSIVSSANTQIAASGGAITYGASTKTANVTMQVVLAGETKSDCTISVRIPAHVKSAQEYVTEEIAMFDWAKIKSSNTDQDAVISNLSLSTSSPSYYTTISWTSDKPQYVSTSGTVTRPGYAAGDAQVTLTVKVDSGGLMGAPTGEPGSQTKDIVVTVKALTQQDAIDAQPLVETAAAKMQDTAQYTIKYSRDSTEVADLDAIINDLSLSVANSILGTGTNATSVAWSSTNPALIVNTYRGKVVRPIGQPDATGVLTATISKNGAAATVDFPVTIKALTQADIDAEKAFLDRVADALVFDTVKGTNTDSQSVVKNFSLVYRGIPGATASDPITFGGNSGEKNAQIEWESSVDTTDGLMPYMIEGQAGYWASARPNLNAPDKEGTLTATLTSYNIRYHDDLLTVKKEIDFTVLANSNYLKGVSLAKGTLMKEGTQQPAAFSRVTDAYDVRAPLGETEAVLTVQKKDPTATITASATGTAQPAASGNSYTVALDGSPKVVTLAVKSGSAIKNYTFNIHAKTADPLPSYTSEWGSFRGANNAGATATPTARTATEAQHKWKVDLDTGSAWKTVGAPIIVDGKIYFAVDDTINVIEKNGAVLQTGQLAAGIGYSSFAAHGGGMIFVPISDGRIQALNAQTLESVWISTELPGWQAGSPILYEDGFIYTGFYQYVSDGVTNGKFVCMSVTDDDTSKGDEEKTAAWTHTITAGTMQGFYWAGAVSTGSAILVGGDDGVLASLDPADGSVLGSVDAGGPIRSSIVYENGKAYFTTKVGKLFRVPVNANGTFGTAASAILSGADSTSSPVVAGNRLYTVSGDGFGDNSKLDVFDAATLARISTADLGGYSQSSPLISTAYATAQNGNKVYLYVMLNDATDDVVCVTDSEKLAVPKVEKLYAPGGMYSMGSLICDDGGAMYFTDGNGALHAVASKKLFVTGVTLDKTASSIAIGGKLQLNAAVQPQDAPEQGVSWSSDNAAVATVSNSGLVTCIAPGTATITVTTEESGKTAACAVMVKTVDTPVTPTAPATQKVTGIKLAAETKTIKVGKTFSLKPTALPANAEKKGIALKSSNSKVATVSSKGVVKGVKNGKAVITATAKDGSGVKAKCTVYVGTPVSKVKLDKASASVRAGKTLKLKASLSPLDASYKGVIWSSSNTKVATINNKGVVKGIKTGTAKITVTAKDGSGKKAVCMIKVVGKK